MVEAGYFGAGGGRARESRGRKGEEQGLGR